MVQNKTKAANVPQNAKVAAKKKATSAYEMESDEKNSAPKKKGSDSVKGKGDKKSKHSDKSVNDSDTEMAAVEEESAADSDDKGTSVDEIDYALKKTIEGKKKRQSKMIPSRAVLAKPDGKRMRWTEAEDEALINGMIKYKDTAWAKICDDPDFSDTLKYRSNRDLKDRYVNLRTLDVYDFSAFDKLRAIMKVNEQKDTDAALEKRAHKLQQAEREKQQQRMTQEAKEKAEANAKRPVLKGKKTKGKK